MISTHAPRAERDVTFYSYNPPQSIFQPTRPVRSATKPALATVPLPQFQPTRPVRSATLWTTRCEPWATDFNPRAPCGARHEELKAFCRRYDEFQPTRPVRP